VPQPHQKGLLTITASPLHCADWSIGVAHGLVSCTTSFVESRSVVACRVQDTLRFIDCINPMLNPMLI